MIHITENLYIQLNEKGKAFGAPYLESNLLHAYGEIPPNFEPYVKVVPPHLDIYETFVTKGPICKKIDGVWKEVWPKRAMLPHEKVHRQNQEKQRLSEHPHYDNYTAWSWNSETCQYDPPIPRPNNGKEHLWHGGANTWIELVSYS